MLGSEIPYDMILSATAAAIGSELHIRPELGAFKLTVTRGRMEVRGTAANPDGVRGANSIVNKLATGLPVRSLLLVQGGSA